MLVFYYILIMTVEEFEQKLSDNGWKHYCWCDLWGKENKEISFPELNYFKQDFSKINLNEIKVKYKDNNGNETIVESEEEILKLIN